ncbi:MAG: acyl-CoA dehydrogenase family protein [bacterium]
MNQDRNLPYYQPEDFYAEEPFFQKLMQHYLPAQEFAYAQEYLAKMGKLSAREFSPLVLTTDLQRPRHIPYDPCGRRIDKIEYDQSYLTIARKAYEFGIIGLGHAPEFLSQGRRYGPLLKFGVGYLFSQAGSVLYCPICMTDGTLQVLQRHGSRELKEKWIPRLTSLDYQTMYDGAMYLTEVQGGSDVGANSCRAKLENGEWRLYGEKWFCSNIGSRTSLVLARPEGAPEGTRGLGLFLLPRNLESGERNKIRVDRVKNKLGTCEMATGEITLEGALAYPVGELERGFSYMTDMLNLSRVYNSVWSIGLMRRAFLEARHYARGRRAFGKAIAEYPLVARTLRQMELDTERATALVFETLNFMDKLEAGRGDAKDETLLRLLTPVIKFFTAEQAITAGHRAIEIFGGNGCVEDFPVAKLLRDAQILAIWEGTANVLSLDFLRVLKKSEAGDLCLEFAAQKIAGLQEPARQEHFRREAKRMRESLHALVSGKDGHSGELACRDTAWELALFLQQLIQEGLS